MKSKADELRKEADSLRIRGNRLLLAMIKDAKGLPDETEKELKDNGIELPIFKNEYQSWYSEALALIRQILPDRESDFIKQYKDEKRKEVDFLTYGISDYLLGLVTRYGGEVKADQSAAVPKMQNQTAMLDAAVKRFESSLFDLQEVVQADLFDSELDAADELVKKGFVRAAGVIAGVVLERHLRHVCAMHGEKSRKKNPSIADYNEILKKSQIIETSKWRFIQHLADIRNLCGHDKERDPTKEEVQELIKGVSKVIKTTF